MAEPVIIPVNLEVTDIDMSGVNFVDAEKQISKSLSGIRQQIQDVFKGIDPSAINKPIEKSMTAVEKSVQSVEDAHLRLREAMVRAGKSSEEYKSKISEANAAIRNQQALVNELSQLGPAAAPHLAEAQKELDSLIEARNKINPIDFVDNAEPIQLEKVADAYKKVLSATDAVNKQSEKFNQTVQDNKLTDEYTEMLKQAEEYKKKLEELDTKSKRMEALGATDKQWEALRYDTEQVSSSMDTLVKKMREAVKTGKAFRFGEGNKGELSRQINSLSMSVSNRAVTVKGRATKNESPYTEDYQKSLNELDKLEKKIETIREKSAKMIELGASKKQFESLVYDAEQLDVKVDEVKNHLMNVVNEGGAFKFEGGDAAAEISKIQDKSNSLQSTLTGVATDAKKAQGGLTALGATHPKLAAILTVAGKIATGFGKVLSVVGKVSKAIITGFVGAVKVLGKVASAVGKVVSGFVNLGKRIFSSIKNINLFGKSGSKHTTDMSSRFKKLTKNFLMFGLGFRTAYYAIKRLRTIFIESFKVMGDQFDEVGQPMMRMMEAFNRLKGSLATAFQPLVSVVMPILTQFMNHLSGALETVGKFFAALTGQGHIYKAVAKNINSVSDSAEEANNKLGSYDKLEVIQKDSSNSNNTGVDYEKQELDATGAASNFANMVKEAWEKADFTSVGQFVTEKLLGVLDNVETNIVPKVTSFVNRVLMSVNTFLTGFDTTAIGEKFGSITNAIVDGLDFEQIGALFANLNNTIWGFFDGLANTIDWTTLGQSIAEGVSSLFSNLDLDSWVGMTSGLTNGITYALSQMLDSVDWTSIAEKLGTTVNNLFANINTVHIGSTIKRLFSTLWSFIGKFFRTVDFEYIAGTLSAGIDNIFGETGAFGEAMPAVASGLVTFFTTAIEQIDWNAIATTLINGLQIILQSLGEAMSSSNNPIISAFGNVILAINEVITILRPAIKSIITVLSPIIQSILPVISTLLPPIAEILAQAVEMVLPVIISLFETFMPIITDMVNMILPLVLDLLQSLQPIFDAFVETVLPVIVHQLEVFMPLIESILGLVVDLLAPLMSLLGPLIEIVFDILDPIITILEPIISVLTTVCDILGAVLRPILDTLTPILSAVSELFELLSPIIAVIVHPLTQVADAFKFAAGIITAILVPVIKILMGIIEALMNVVGMVADAFEIAFEGIRSCVDTVWGKIKGIFNWILGGIESLANGIIRGVNNVIKALNKFSFDVPDWVTDLTGITTFGFNIRELKEISIPRLAQGAVIPPNREFLAMLGDQKHGTNIEAPLDTIKQALAEVLAEVGGGTREPIVLEVNGRTLAKVVWDEQEKRYKQTGHARA